MATVQQQPAAIPLSRSVECAIAIGGLVVAGIIAFICLDLLFNSALVAGVAGGADSAETSPAPDIPRPRPAPEARDAS